MSILPASAAPAIELSPGQGPVGTSVDIEGSGFVALSTVTLTFDKQSLPTVPETIIADALGKFEATFHVPSFADAGKNAVVATTEIIFDNEQDGKKDDDEKEDDKKRDHDDKDDEDDEDEDDEDDDKGGHHDDKPHIPRSKASTTFIVLIDANDPPVADDIAVETKEDIEVRISLTGSDDKSAAVSFSVNSDPGHGNLSDIESTGSNSAEIMYTPLPDYNGKDSFEINVSDSKGDSDTAKVDITVISVNDAPVAAQGEIKTRKGELVSFSITASDVDGDILSYVIIANPSHGALSGTAPNLKYAPFSNYLGSDAFTFKVNDGNIDSNAARVTVSVTPLTTHSRSGGSSLDVITIVSDGTSVNTDNALTEATSQPISGGISQFFTDVTGTGQAINSGTIPFFTDVTGTGSIGSIRDSQPPKLILPVSPLEVGAISELGALVTYSVTALDDFDGEITPYCSPESGFEFPVGTVNVVCKASDRAGNSALASFVVAVKLIAQEERPSVLIPFLIMGLVGAASFGGFWAVRRT